MFLEHERVSCMNIVILESSPHKNGASNTLADYFIKGAEEAGHTVDVLDVAHMDIKPCMGCYAGKSEGHCRAHKDDMYLVEQALARTDMVVYVTPVYFYDMSAQLKLVIDRLHCFYGSLPRKKSLLLATAWRQDDEVMFYLRNLYNGMAEYLRYENLGAVMAKGCGSSETIHGSRYAKEAYQFGKNLK